MKVLLDARTATSQFPGTGRYTIELAAALSELFSKTGDELVLIINQDAEEQFRKIKNLDEKMQESLKLLIHLILQNAQPL